MHVGLWPNDDPVMTFHQHLYASLAVYPLAPCSCAASVSNGRSLLAVCNISVPAFVKQLLAISSNIWAILYARFKCSMPHKSYSHVLCNRSINNSF